MIAATLAEWRYVPRAWGGAQHLTKRLMFLILVFVLTLAPSVYVFFIDDCTTKVKKDGQKQCTKVSLILGVVQFFISVIAYFFFSIMPLGGLFGSYFNSGDRRYTASQTFTASFPRLRGNDMWMSYGIWVLIFGTKLAESYICLTLSIKDPIRILSLMKIENCIGDSIFGKGDAAKILCRIQPQVVLGLMIFTDLILFFLDTYLWQPRKDVSPRSPN